MWCPARRVYIQRIIVLILLHAALTVRAEESVCVMPLILHAVLDGFLNRGEAAALVCTGGSWAELGPPRGGIDALSCACMSHHRKGWLLFYYEFRLRTEFCFIAVLGKTRCRLRLGGARESSCWRALRNHAIDYRNLYSNIYRRNFIEMLYFTETV